MTVYETYLWAIEALKNFSLVPFDVAIEAASPRSRKKNIRKYGQRRRRQIFPMTFPSVRALSTLTLKDGGLHAPSVWSASLACPGCFTSPNKMITKLWDAQEKTARVIYDRGRLILVNNFFREGGIKTPIYLKAGKICGTSSGLTLIGSSGVMGERIPIPRHIYKIYLFLAARWCWYQAALRFLEGSVSWDLAFPRTMNR